MVWKNDPDLTVEQFNAARENLSVSAINMAWETRLVLGAGWWAVDNPPNTWDALKEAVRHTHNTGEPLPVTSAWDPSSSLYTSRYAQTAARFWHDVDGHVLQDFDFTGPNEIRAARYQVEKLRKTGWVDDIELQMLWLHLAGLNMCIGTCGYFPEHERAFVYHALRFGTCSAVELAVNDVFGRVYVS